MTNVNGRICLVTGAASGIGRLLSLELADRGAHLVLWDMDAARLDSVVNEVRASRKGKAWGFRCDVTDRAMVDRMADRVRAEVGDPVVVVNNAGIVSGQRLVDLAPEQIERTFAVNVLALYWVTKAFLPAMLAHGDGHIVTVASAAGLVGVANKRTTRRASMRPWASTNRCEWSFVAWDHVCEQPSCARTTSTPGCSRA